MAVAQSNGHSKTSADVVNEKRGCTLLTEPTGCWVEIGMKHQMKKPGFRRQEVLGGMWGFGAFLLSSRW
jgi:hypothetical protein